MFLVWVAWRRMLTVGGNGEPPGCRRASPNPQDYPPAAGSVKRTDDLGKETGNGRRKNPRRRINENVAVAGDVATGETFNYIFLNNFRLCGGF